MPADAAFRRIAADIRRRIEAGEWQVGDALPSRTRLAAEYRVHPETMRLAYALLRRSGTLEGERRRAVYVAHPPAMRVLTNPDAAWPHGQEITDSRSCRASPGLAARLSIEPGTRLRCERVECFDPGGRSAMVITTWWRGRRRRHVRAVAELGTTQVTDEDAAALGLTVDTPAFLLMRTRLDDHGTPTETADLVLPMDRWLVRISPGA
ncbi:MULTISPECIES: GntR family transcriptional regulator [Streptomyces]|uniref:GntR family transcriptional regulator n=1 Tax=Streptomyces TaxID=1883 RepID=UPI00099DACA7|nr:MULTISPECIES: GntR family transcriptional regulator [Streptomyces]QEV11601.1 GntR family transcriptional regulator [Streptomyces fradiae ATCC 10745 = DSM 40063]